MRRIWRRSGIFVVCGKMLHFFLKRFSGCFRIFLYRKFALEEFSEERLAAEDEEDDDHHPDLYLAEHFRVVEVGEP